MFAGNLTYAVYVMTTSNINCKYFTTFFNVRKGHSKQFIIIGAIKLVKHYFRNVPFVYSLIFSKHGNKRYCRTPRTFFGDVSVKCRRYKRSKALLNEIKHRNQTYIFIFKNFRKKSETTYDSTVLCYC